MCIEKRRHTYNNLMVYIVAGLIAGIVCVSYLISNPLHNKTAFVSQYNYLFIKVT